VLSALLHAYRCLMKGSFLFIYVGPIP
jgi:hypothetical protein